MCPERELKIVPMVENQVDTAMSCPDLRIRYDVEIREFVILACLKDLDVADTTDIARAIGLAPTTVTACLASLLENGLVRTENGLNLRYVPTTDGLALVRKASAH